MTFVVRQISRTADGRDIVREASHEGDSIVIGRAADSAIQLPDLAVETQHARVTRLTGLLLRVQSIGGLGFEVEGRTTMDTELDIKRGAELRFGGHRLTLSEAGGNAVFTIERIDALSDSSEVKDRSGIFTLKSLLPGKRFSAYFYIALILLACLAWPIYSYATSKGVKERDKTAFHADTMWEAGALSRGHKTLEKDCQACHVNAFESVRDDSCVACHKNTHDHAPAERLAEAKAPPGLGGKVELFFKTSFNVPVGSCVECHTEHEGAGPMQPTAQRFCADCHGGLNERLKDTKILNAADFSTDHPEFHPAVVFEPGERPLARRVSLASNPMENNGLKFPHALHLSKTGGVARMGQTMSSEFGFGAALACKDCHVPTPDGVRFKPVEMEKNCGMCHSLAFDTIGGTIRTMRHGEPEQVAADLRAFYRSTGPVRPINLGGQARRLPGDYAAGQTAQDFASAARQRPARSEDAIRAVFSKGGACFDCHVVTPAKGPSTVGYDVGDVVQPMRYMQKGWFDHEAHKEEKCESCHTKADGSKSANDLLLPDIKSCRTCHGGESARAEVPSSCAMCHDYHADDGAPWLTKVNARNPKKPWPKRAGSAPTASRR